MKLKKGDFVKDGHGKIYRISSIDGTTITAAPKQSKGYGGPVTLHSTKVTKVDNVNESNSDYWMKNRKDQYDRVGSMMDAPSNPKGNLIQVLDGDPSRTKKSGSKIKVLGWERDKDNSKSVAKKYGMRKAKIMKHPVDKRDYWLVEGELNELDTTIYGGGVNFSQLKTGEKFKFNPKDDEVLIKVSATKYKHSSGKGPFTTGKKSGVYPVNESKKGPYLKTRNKDDDDLRSKGIDVKKAKSIGKDAGKRIVSRMKNELDEKAKSEIQQQAAGAALAAKRGEIPASELTGASKRMYDDMTEDQLEDFAGTKHDNVPTKVEEMFSEYRRRFSYVLKRTDTYPIITEGIRSFTSGLDEAEKGEVSYVTVRFPSSPEKSNISKVKGYSEKNGYSSFQIAKGNLHFTKDGKHIDRSEEQKLQREISKLVGMEIEIKVVNW